MSDTLDATLPEGAIERSYAYCQALTRKEARNFYFGLKLLPEPKRSAMYALYAYMRLADDIADDDQTRSTAQRSEDLENWRMQTHAVLQGDAAALRKGPLWPAVGALARTYKIPRSLFDAMIEGQRQDLVPRVIQDFDELESYCYRVAGVVGLASIRVWGFTGGSATEKLAIDRGTAFQLTNVLRDLREDAGRGRCYLPAEEMARHNITPADIAAGQATPALTVFLTEQVQRAERYYQASAPLVKKISEDSRPTLLAMTEIYHSILKKIAADPARVLRQRVGLSTMNKLAIGWRALRAK